MRDRDVDPQNIQVKIGADDGQGLLKICAQLLKINPDEKPQVFYILHGKIIRCNIFITLGWSQRVKCT